MRTVVVTGGAKGIGRALAGRFAGLGDRVVALGRDRAALDQLEPELHTANVRVETAVCDVTDEQAVRRVFAAIGDVDVLVNNAGIAESAPLRRCTLQDWQAHLAVNATGPFLCTREVVGRMLERDRGRIVTVASTAARIGVPYTAAYTASKHAALGLMRVTAAEVAGTGVTANAVCPAFVDTALTDRAVERIVASTGRSAEQSRARLAAAAPLGRLLEPQEVADAVVWLASAGAGAVNGQALVLDGGGIQA